jgi:hypothetical protein
VAIPLTQVRQSIDAASHRLSAAGLLEIIGRGACRSKSAAAKRLHHA